MVNPYKRLKLAGSTKLVHLHGGLQDSAMEDYKYLYNLKSEDLYFLFPSHCSFLHGDMIDMPDF